MAVEPFAGPTREPAWSGPAVLGGDVAIDADQGTDLGKAYFFILSQKPNGKRLQVKRGVVVWCP